MLNHGYFSTTFHPLCYMSYTLLKSHIIFVLYNLSSSIDFLIGVVRVSKMCRLNKEEIYIFYVTPFFVLYVFIYFLSVCNHCCSVMFFFRINVTDKLLPFDLLSYVIICILIPFVVLIFWNVFSFIFCFKCLVLMCNVCIYSIYRVLTYSFSYFFLFVSCFG